MLFLGASVALTPGFQQVRILKVCLASRGPEKGFEPWRATLSEEIAGHGLNLWSNRHTSGLSLRGDTRATQLKLSSLSRRPRTAGLVTMSRSGSAHHALRAKLLAETGLLKANLA